MKLSLRLAAVAAMVTPGTLLADIGTDHAYIPIELARKGLIPHAIAIDVNPGPLMRAQENIGAHGLEGMIETRLSDGLKNLRPQEAQSIVIAGMGGALTRRILREGAAVLECVDELILQPQSEVPQVRRYLEQSGMAIVQEDMVYEDGKYYPMMRAVPARAGRIQAERMQAAEEAFGPVLLRSRHPVLHRYLLEHRKKLSEIQDSLKNGRDEAAKIRLDEIREEVQLTEDALRVYGGGMTDGKE